MSQNPYNLSQVECPERGKPLPNGTAATKAYLGFGSFFMHAVQGLLEDMYRIKREAIYVIVCVCECYCVCINILSQGSCGNGALGYDEAVGTPQRSETPRCA